MEWALHVPGTEGLERIGEPWSGSPERREIIEKIFGPVKFTRIYFGQEFCQRALPGAAGLLEAIRESGRRGLDFTLVTPYITEKGLERLEALFRELAAKRPGAEVVANDWGTLYLLHRNFQRLEPVLGRLLNKALKDPRLSCRLNQMDAGDLESYCGSVLAGTYMERLIRALGVRRVELDNLFQGLDQTLPRRGYRISLYIPYGPVATGRICLLGSWGLDPGRKFSATSWGCSRQCRRHHLGMDAPGLAGGPPGRNFRILQMGNTVFYEQTGEFLAAGLDRAKKLGVCRIVYQPGPD